MVVTHLSKVLQSNFSCHYSLFSYCTPFVTVVSIQEPDSSAKSGSKNAKNARDNHTAEEGLACGKMVASSHNSCTASSSKHLVRRTSSPAANAANAASKVEPGYVTVLEIGSNHSNNNNNNNKAEVKRPNVNRYQFYFNQ